MEKIRCSFGILLLIIVCSHAGPIEDISTMPDLSLFYQQLIRQPDLQGLLQGIYNGQQTGIQGDFTIFAPNNDAMARLNRRNEDPAILWKYHIVPGVYTDQVIYNLAQERFSQTTPQQAARARPQNNLGTMALPFQIFYGLGYYGGVGPYIDIGTETNTGGATWLSQTPLNQSYFYESNNRLNPYMSNVNNYNPSQNQNYVVAQGAILSNNPNLFPQNLTNYYTNVFNPNVNTQFLQNANPPDKNSNTYMPQSQFYGPMTTGSIGILRPTINNAFILQTRSMSRGVINVIDNILWPPERLNQMQYKTVMDILEDSQFSRLRILAERSEYFRSELRSLNHQTWFLPNDQAFTTMGSSLNFLFDPGFSNNTNDINDFIKSHIVPIVLYPSTMDASKQLSTLSLGKWVTFRKTFQSDQSFQVDVILNRQVARILSSRPEEIRIFGNGVAYPISTILSGPTRSAADELARSYQYFMALIKQSGDTELVNVLQGSTAGLGNTGPNIYNPENLLRVTVLIPQQISVEQLGNSEALSQNLRRHILRLPVYTDRFSTSTPVPANYPPGYLPRSNKKPTQRGLRRRRRRQINMPINGNFPNGMAPQQMPNQQVFPDPSFIPSQGQQMFPTQQQQQQQQQMFPTQQQQIPIQAEQLNPTLNPTYYQMPAYPTSATFQDGQIYQTMDPQYTVQVQISSGSNGNVVTLIGRPDGSTPFTATILNTESNIPIKNGVMHVIRGILSGSVIPLDTVLTTLQGANSFTQLLQQTGVLNQLQQSNRAYTLFIPTNAALQSIGVTTNINRIRQFVLRHVCADVLLDPMANVLRRSAGYYSRNRPPVPNPSTRSRRKRQDWADAWRNGTIPAAGPPVRAPDLGPGYFQPQQQVYGGYPAAPSPYGFYNQLYNPSYVMSGYAAPNSQYYYGYNETFSPMDYLQYQQTLANYAPMSTAVWNSTLNAFYVPSINVAPINGGSGDGNGQSYYTGTGGYFTGSSYVGGPQSCMAMTGERITVQPLTTGATGAVPQPVSYQNFIVTCCGDQSVNAMVQSFNVYPPSFAVYLIGRSILSQGQTINNLPNNSIAISLSLSMLVLILLSFIYIRFRF